MKSHAWKQTGRLSLWRYTENERNYPGWHLNGDAQGCQALINLLEALAADGGGSRTLALVAPTEAQLNVPNNQSGRAAWVAPEKLRLTLATTAGQWVFPAAFDPAELTIGADWLQPLREGVAGISAGQGDYAIGDRATGFPLWFWW